MTVSSSILSHSYIPGAAMLAESLAGLVAIEPSDLVVTDPAGLVQVLGTDYEITGNLRTGAASIRTLRAYAVGLVLTVRRVTQRVQNASIPVAQPMPSVAIERELDRHALISAELDVEISRAIRVPEGELGPAFPSLAAAEGHVLGVAGGQLIPVQNDLISAASDAALAAISRTQAQTAATAAHIDRLAADLDKAGCDLALTQSLLAALAAGVYPYANASVLPSGIASGKTYWTASADSKSLLLWKNNAGVIEPVNMPDSSQIALPSAAGAGDLLNILEGPFVTTAAGNIGPAGALITGSGISQQQEYWLDLVPPDADACPSFDAFDHGAGDYQVAYYRQVASVWTLQGTGTVTFTGSGAQVTKNFSSALPVIGGDMMAGRAISVGVISYVGGGTGAGVYNDAATGAFPSTIAPGGASGITPQIRFNFTKTARTSGLIDKLNTLSQKAGTPTPLAPADYPARYLTSAGYNGFITTGQSNDTGIGAQPAKSITQWHQNITFGGGVRSSRAGNAWGAVNTAPGTSTTKPLVEENSSGGSPAADGAGNEGETLCTGATTAVCERALIYLDVDPSNNRWFASCAGHTGYSITSLNKGSTWYNQLISHATDAFARCGGLGKGYVVSAVSIAQGEADAGMAEATYQGHLTTFQSDIDTDIRAITGQTEPVHLIVWQVAGSNNGGATIADVAKIRRAQYNAAAASSRIHLIGPMYPFEGLPDQIHMTPTSKKIMAEYTGRVLYELVDLRQEPSTLKPVSAYARGTELRLKFDVPYYPLVLDPNWLGTVVDHGFKVSDGTGTLVLSNIRVADEGDTIIANMNRVLAATPVVEYGNHFVSSATNLTLCAGGTLRDSHPETYLLDGTTHHLYNVCPAYQMPIAVLETQA